MNQSLRLGLLFLGLLTFSLAGCQSEYSDGYRKAVDDVRESRRQLGVIGEAGGHLINELGVGGDSSKSDEWNRGYRQGLNAELNK